MIVYHHNKLSRLAFTLAELVIVIAVISLLAAAATVTFSKAAAHAQLNAAADQLTADLRLAREHARQNRQLITFQFDTDARTYQAASVPNLHHTGNVAVNLARAPYCIARLTMLEDGEADDAVKFDATGRIPTDTTITLARGSSAITLYVYEDGKIERDD